MNPSARLSSRAVSKHPDPFRRLSLLQDSTMPGRCMLKPRRGDQASSEALLGVVSVIMVLPLIPSPRCSGSPRLEGYSKSSIRCVMCKPNKEHEEAHFVVQLTRWVASLTVMTISVNDDKVMMSLKNVPERSFQLSPRIPRSFAAQILHDSRAKLASLGASTFSASHRRCCLRPKAGRKACRSPW